MLSISKVSVRNLVPTLIALAAIVSAIVWLERPTEVAACTNGETSELLSFSFADEFGTCRALADLAAPVTVINAWASWCPFCVEELPDFGILSEEFPDVPIIAINRAEVRERASAFVDELDVPGDVVFLFDPEDSFYKSIEGFAMPETVFIDQNGTTLLHKRGIMSLEEMRTNLETLLNRAQPHTSVENTLLCLGDGQSACAAGHFF